MIAIANNIKAERIRAGLTVEDMAQQCGWSSMKQYRFENGTTDPRACDLQVMADALKKPASVFFPTTTPAPDSTKSAQANADAGSVIHNPTPDSASSDASDIEPPSSGDDRRC